jgi:hypothetical protein
VRPQDLLEDIYLHSKKETKLSEERQGYKVILSLPKKSTRSMHEIRRKTRISGKFRPSDADSNVLNEKI